MENISIKKLTISIVAGKEGGGGIFNRKIRSWRLKVIVKELEVAYFFPVVISLWIYVQLDSCRHLQSRCTYAQFEF